MLLINKNLESSLNISQSCQAHHGFSPNSRDIKRLPKKMAQIVPFMETIQKSSQKNQVPQSLIVSVIYHESRGKLHAKSPKGAMGLMQLMPATAKELGVKNPFDPKQNIEGGTRYLKKMLNRFNGRIDLALAAYNAGPGNVLKYKGVPPFKETQNYVKKNLTTITQLENHFTKNRSFISNKVENDSDPLNTKNNFKTHPKLALNRLEKKQSVQENFFQMYAMAAKIAQSKTRIPASVSLAQAALATGYGRYAKHHNLFGLKNSFSNLRKFPSPLEGFLFHAEIISQGKNLKHAMKHTASAKQFVQSLQSGEKKYATDPKYTEKIIKIIDRYNLEKYDAI